MQAARRSHTARVRGILESHYRVLIAIYAAIMLAAGSWFCFLTPIFKAPDEAAHIFRADQVSQGHLLSSKTELGMGGGQIDRAYGALNQFVTEIDVGETRRLTKDHLQKVKTFKAVGEHITAAFPNTASYFALGYLPQAIGLILGRSISDAAADHVIAARLANLVSFVLIVSSAFFVSPSGAPLFLCLSAMPMVIFMGSSASQDVSIISMSILALAFYLRIFASPDKSETNPHARVTYPLIGFSLCLLILSLARLTYAPYFLLVAAIPLILRDRRLFFLSAVICVVACVVLIAQAGYIASLGHPTSKPGIDPAAQVSFIFAHPMRYLIIQTSSLQMQGYFLESSFIGILGNLDLWLPQGMYLWCKIAMGLAVLLQIAAFCGQHWREELLRSGSTLLVVGTACVATILAMELTITSQYLVWTIPGSPVIEGLQGRYFYTPVLFLTAIVLAAFAAQLQPLLAQYKPATARLLDALPDPMATTWIVFLPALVVSQIVVGLSLLKYYS